MLRQHRPPGRRVRNAPSLGPASSTSSSRCHPPPYFAQPLCTPSPLVFAWAMSTPSLVKHLAPLNASRGPRSSPGLPRPCVIPLPLSMPHVAPCGALRYLRLPRSLPPPIGSAMVHPPPPPPGLALAPQACYPIRWPGLVAWSFGSGLRPPASLSGPRSGPWLVLTAPWLFRCSLVRVWAPALRPLSPLPLLHYESPLTLLNALAFSPLLTTLPLFYLTIVLQDVIV